MKVRVTEFVKQYLYCMDSKAGETMLRPLGETVHGRRLGKVLHFDYLYVRDSGLLGKDGLYDGDGFKYILVMMVDLSEFRVVRTHGTLHGSLDCEVSTWVA